MRRTRRYRASLRQVHIVPARAVAQEEGMSALSFTFVVGLSFIAAIVVCIAAG